MTQEEEEEWDPFADPADDPEALAQAQEEARAREVWDKSPGHALAVQNPGYAATLRPTPEEEELEAELDGAGFLQAFPPPVLAPGELCVAHFVIAAPPAEVILRLPRLMLECKQAQGAQAQPLTASVSSLLAWWPSGRIQLLEPAPAKDPARFGQETVGGVATCSRAVAHTVAMLPRRIQEAPQLEDVENWKQYQFLDLRDFLHFAPASDGGGPRTLVRRAFWGLQGEQTGDIREELCDLFEDENRRWVAHWTPELAPLPALCFSQPMLAIEGERSRGPPPTLDLEKAIQLQDMLIAEYSRTEFQVKLHVSWASAGDDEVKKLKGRREICLPIQGPVVDKFGFEPSQKGVNQSISAFKPFNDHPEVARRNLTMQYLVNPQQQDEQFIEGHLNALANASSQQLYGALRAPDLYRPDKTLVTQAKNGEGGKVRLSIQQNHADPNIIVPDKLGFISEARSRFYFIEERTPLVAAVEFGQPSVFDILMSYDHLVDVNTVCLEWSVSECYKSYTALDLGQACLKNRTHAAAAAMVNRLLAAGAKPAEELPHPRRENPFKQWQKHFPDANLPKGIERLSFQREDSGGGMDYGPDPDPGPERPTWVESEVDDQPRRAASWMLPPPPADDNPDLKVAVAELRQRLLNCSGSTPEERQRFLRSLFLEWHPDKNPLRQQLATKVFQWLQGVKDSS